MGCNLTQTIQLKIIADQAQPLYASPLSRKETQIPFRRVWPGLLTPQTPNQLSIHDSTTDRTETPKDPNDPLPMFTGTTAHPDSGPVQVLTGQSRLVTGEGLVQSIAYIQVYIAFVDNTSLIMVFSRSGIIFFTFGTWRTWVLSLICPHDSSVPLSSQTCVVRQSNKKYSNYVGIHIIGQRSRMRKWVSDLLLINFSWLDHTNSYFQSLIIYKCSYCSYRGMHSLAWRGRAQNKQEPCQNHFNCIWRRQTHTGSTSPGPHTFFHLESLVITKVQRAATALRRLHALYEPDNSTAWAFSQAKSLVIQLPS